MRRVVPTCDQLAAPRRRKGIVYRTVACFARQEDSCLVGVLVATAGTNPATHSSQVAAGKTPAGNDFGFGSSTGKPPQ